jgi:hypothetical protein
MIACTNGTQISWNSEKFYTLKIVANYIAYFFHVYFKKEA